MENIPKQTSLVYLRNFIFGVEDSLVSTVGLLSGIAVAEVPKDTLILTGMILIFVEAFSMGVGSFLSEDTVEQAGRTTHSMSGRSRNGSLIMFFSYFLSGFIPLAPYLVSEGTAAFWASILASLMALFLLGVISARLYGIQIARNGLRMLMLGGLAIAVGVIVGTLVPTAR